MSDSRSYSERVADAAALREKISVAEKKAPAPDLDGGAEPDAYDLKDARAMLAKDEADAEAEAEG